MEDILEHEIKEIARQISEGYTSGHLNDGEGNALYYELKVNIISRAGDEIVCPICGSAIRVKRIDDGVSMIEIAKDGITWESKGSHSDGSTLVYCSNDEEHELPHRLIEKCLDIWERYESGEV